MWERIFAFIDSIDTLLSFIVVTLVALIGIIGRLWKRARWWLAKILLNISRENVEDIATFQRIRAASNNPDMELWSIRAPLVPRVPEVVPYDQRPKILTIVNLKGGVGKTTLAANYAAYLSRQKHAVEDRNIHVLIMDLDYQGSLSTTLMSAVGETNPETHISSWFDDDITTERALTQTENLNAIMPGCRVAVADALLTSLENRLLVRWLLHETHDDVKFRLARHLWTNEVGKRFDVVVLDAPPRLSTGAVAALCASNFYIVPTIMDDTSIQPIEGLIVQFDRLFGSLDLNPYFAGVVGCRTFQENTLGVVEQDAWDRVRNLMQRRGMGSRLFDRHVPDLARISQAAGRKIAYLGAESNDADGQDRRVRRIFDELGEQISQQIGLATRSPEP